MKITNRDDLIRRADAIDEIVSLQNGSDMPEDWEKGVSAALSCLFRVPKADTEHSTFA